MEETQSTSTALERFLLSRKEAILQGWCHAVRATYPAETAAFLASEKDRFSNPVGHTLRQTGEVLLEVALSGMERERMESDLSDIVRVRAVQDFSPSQALSFVDAMKEAIRREILPMVAEKTGLTYLLCVESRLDQAMHAAVDLYVACRNQIGDIRIKEAKAEKERLLRLIKAMGRGSDGFLAGGPNWTD
jgi:hypothetical protein